MNDAVREPGVHVNACEACGRLPHPRRVRLALAKLCAVFPVELLLHALVIHVHASYLITVAVLTVTTTVLVIWVVEPSAMRLLGGWLHGPPRGEHGHLATGQTLWRIRVRVSDRPGQLESLARNLAELDANILTVHVHHLDGGSLDELIVGACRDTSPDALSKAVRAGGGHDVGIWPASALALIDGQTKALTLATRVAADPSELPLSIAELLGAQYVDSRVSDPPPAAARVEIPTGEGEALVFVRSADEPFTPAENARARRLGELAQKIRGMTDAVGPAPAQFATDTTRLP
ncbi:MULTISPECIES: amino acid-binding protein [unclassified Rhodococcus (in: high G+C Gram-positive bacteria)]|uniref:amino acid-binding protein n=1 Tax=unclassified Rhodococcus (in: high G+C Gram-positive bacteria) TaxID=192944 RepID=UPI00163B42E8|nr:MULTISPECIES: amino acid-binding protein [unclassified Rhodococcus (in: high G+C Gram-positive bacteria)]MBC2641832.1 amino acid-binding protein [Rhodococcus sp. 3A]MBC2893424.1 amino acid-binding protein [Rhodococcus sp. 4CII]